jgi:hypothetical protein
MDVLEKVWDLRTHPFSPSCDPLGRDLTFDASRSLDPSDHDRLLHLYFDIYNWDQSKNICQLSPTTGLSKFPNLENLVRDNDTQVVIISGRDTSGVQSMVNLIKYKAKQSNGEPPLMFSAPINIHHETSLGQMYAGWSQTIVQFFLDTYRFTGGNKENYDSLKEIFDEEKESLEKNSSLYLNLPQRIINIFRYRHKKRPIVFMIDFNQDLSYEHWSKISEIVNKFVNLLIITSRDPINASSFYSSMHKKIEVVHIETSMLNLNKTRKYITKRLELYRVNKKPSGIVPFSEAALQRLFDETETTGNTQPTHTIGWLNKRMRMAIDKQIQILTKYSQENDVTEISRYPENMITIQQELMEQLNSEINQGTI